MQSEIKGQNPYYPTERERRVSAALRAIALAKIESRDPSDVALLLDMKISGLHALVWEQEWSLETAFRVVDALGLEPASVIEDLVKEAQGAA